MNFTLSDFDFDLPADLVAQHPPRVRSESRLLVVGQKSIVDCVFSDIVGLVNPGDVLVFNNSKVIPARLRGTKASGGQVEILVERMTDDLHATALMKASKKIQPGTIVTLNFPDRTRLAADGSSRHAVTVMGRDPAHEDRFLLQFDRPVLSVLDACGEIPLPPYIRHEPTAEDESRYQTVYAQHPGSVAAPTAGLHFDAGIMGALAEKGVELAWVTLHVGSGTFSPVRTDDLSRHKMHSEWCEIPKRTAELITQARQASRRVIAVGTTSLRTLESGAIAGPGKTLGGASGLVRAGAWETDIFIRPGYDFQVVDALLTNFHLPKSTLLMLVAAFMGYDKMRATYQHAIAQRYQFFSYGDAMFCERENRVEI